MRNTLPMILFPVGDHRAGDVEWNEAICNEIMENRADYPQTRGFALTPDYKYGLNQYPLSFSFSTMNFPFGLVLLTMSPKKSGNYTCTRISMNLSCLIVVGWYCENYRRNTVSIWAALTVDKNMSLISPLKLRDVYVYCFCCFDLANISGGLASEDS